MLKFTSISARFRILRKPWMEDAQAGDLHSEHYDCQKHTFDIAQEDDYARH